MSQYNFVNVPPASDDQISRSSVASHNESPLFIDINLFNEAADLPLGSNNTGSISHVRLAFRPPFYIYIIS